jgi:hypothetical protein
MTYYYGQHNVLILNLKVGDKIKYHTTIVAADKKGRVHKMELHRTARIIYMNEWFMTVLIKVKGGLIKETIPYFGIVSGEYTLKGVEV